MRKLAHAILSCVTCLAILILIILGSQKDSLAPLAALIAAPFVALALGALWTIYFIFPTLRKSFLKPPRKQKRTNVHYMHSLGRSSAYLILAGVIILVMFGLVGGPNGISSVGYLPFHASIILIIAGLLLGLIIHVSSNKPSGEK